MLLDAAATLQQDVSSGATAGGGSCLGEQWPGTESHSHVSPAGHAMAVWLQCSQRVLFGWLAARGCMPGAIMSAIPLVALQATAALSGLQPCSVRQRTVEAELG